MAVFLIAWANIRKKKGVAVSMGLLILLSTAMFHTGLTLLTGINGFFARENDRLMGAHYLVRFYGDAYEDSYYDFFTGDDRVEKVEVKEIVLMDSAQYDQGGSLSAQFINMNDEGGIKGYRITGEINVTQGMPVYLPCFMKEMGYQPGDDFTILYNKQSYSFVVAGFAESTWFSSSVVSLINIYMPKESYNKLYEELGGGYMLSVRLKNQEDAEAVRKDFREKTDVTVDSVSLDARVMDFTIQEMQNGCTTLVTILSGVLFVFSFLMVIVALIVIRFRIASHLETQMTSIGALEAMGYTGKQIRQSIVLEFFIIGAAGTLAGVLLSHGLISGLGQFITSSVGISWSGRIRPLTDLAGVAIILMIVLLSSYLTAGKATKILPVRALRQGLESHSFQRNQLPLEDSPGPLFLILGLKQVLFHKKTYLMTGIIFTGISFACAFAAVIFLNFGIRNDLVLRLTGYEISDILIEKAPHMDYDRLGEKLLNTPGIRKVIQFEPQSASVEGTLLTCYLSDDFDSLEMVQVYEGDFPEYDNEIVVTGVLAKKWGKKIGDTVSVLSSDGIQMDFVICGLTQTMNNFGKQCFLSTKGYLQLNPSFEPKNIQVYLDSGLDVNEMITEIENQFSTAFKSRNTPEEDKEAAAQQKAEEKIANLLSMYDVDSAQYALISDGEIIFSGDTSAFEINRAENNRRLFLGNLDSISSSARLLAVIIAVTTLCIITLVFYMVIRSMLIRQRHEFGIYKALGYTDRQLMNQIAISFLPSSLCGTLAGMTLAYASVNRLTSAVFETLGVSQLNLEAPVLMLAGLGIFIVLFSYGISHLISRKMNRITVYELLTEV